MLCLFLVLSSSAFAQLKVHPLPRNSENTPPSTPKQKRNVARTQELVPRSLPFWDDFSWTPVDNGDSLANRPVDSLWVNSRTVWINNGLGIHPPSINIATFNGLDEDNLPYSSEIISKGFCDTLMSQPIMLDEVAGPDRNSVYLSFFYQWNGHGEPPDPNDYLRVQFKNDQGVWENVVTILPLESFTNDVFYDTLVKVEGERFFHETFQFRFMNYGRLSGPFDTWNLDYVYLNKGRSATDRYLPDRSIISPLSGLFNSYTAVPYDHFLAASSDPLAVHPTFDVFNVQNDTSTLSYLTSATFTSYKDSVAQVLVIDTLGDAGTSPIDGLTGIIFPRQRKTVTLQHVPEHGNTIQFPDDADSVKLSLRAQLFTGDTFNPETGEFANDYNPAVYQPLDFRSNDTIVVNYILKNYYAYDDGSADYAVTLTNPSDRAAYLFEMLSADPDTLVGFDIYYPDYGVISNLNVDFTIYGDANGIPGPVVYTLPSYSIRRSGQNKFQRILFGEQFLVEERFYIGWKGPIGGTFKVGLDTNNDAGSKLFANANGQWLQNSDIIGAVMIRPLFGKGGNIITGIPEEEIRSHIFPNPTSGSFFVPRNYELRQITTVTGQAISFTTEQSGDYNRIQLSAAPGLYVLRISIDGQYYSSKIVVK